MTIVDTHNTAAPAASGILALLVRPFVAIGRGLVQVGEAYYEASEASRRAEFLNNLSDEELARRGITRMDIPRIAFGMHTI
jgi:hypothetical protein